MTARGVALHSTGQATWLLAQRVADGRGRIPIRVDSIAASSPLARLIRNLAARSAVLRLALVLLGPIRDVLRPPLLVLLGRLGQVEEDWRDDGVGAAGSEKRGRRSDALAHHLDDRAVGQLILGTVRELGDLAVAVGLDREASRELYFFA